MVDVISKTMTLPEALVEAEKLLSAQALPQAEALYREIIKAQPTYHPAYFQLALIAVQVGKLNVAAQLVARALHFSPVEFVYHRTLCELYRRLRRYDAAIAHGKQATTLAPGDAESQYNYGLALADSGNCKDAIIHYRKAVECNKKHPFAYNNLGSALEKLNCESDAEDAYKKAIRINPDNAEAHNNLGAMLSARGELEKAKSCFDKAIEKAPGFVSAHCNISTIKKYHSQDQHIAILERLRPQIATMAPEEEIKYWFSMGKAWNDTDRPAEAFVAYQRGNMLKRTTFHYDEAAVQKSVDDIIARFNPSLLRRKSRYKDSTPVFIIGMPRSGTTLIEQILSSHSEVHGAGELKDFSEVVGQAIQGPADAYMDWLLHASAADLAEIGKRYVQRLRAYDSAAVLISDKMPGNFFFAGLIHMALPQAKIIHVTRDPLDTCISNYMLLFKETLPFAYDLGELGRYYRMYQRLMDHWRATLPKGAMLEVNYEEVVANVEQQTKRMLEYCGLKWQDDCLEFHKNQRLVKTASVSQVRQPLYASSVGRAQKFKPWLGELLTHLNSPA